MKVILARCWPAIFCVLMLALSAVFIRPYVEMPIIDDGSYIRTAQLLAQTGHIVYNGWATAMLGWQIYLAALLVRLFGFSFTVVRSAVVLVSLTTAFLLQRTFVRAGIRDWNAAIGTLALVLSPLFLSLAFTFMTDVPGLFCVVLCLYACLRAVQAETIGGAFTWIFFATASNAVGGTVRQIAWLGTLVMVPCTLWLVRRRPRILPGGIVVWVGGVATIFAFMHWFNLQPYAIREHLIGGPVGRDQIRNLYQNIVKPALNLPAYLLPVLLMFVPAVSWKNRRAVWFAATGALLCLLVGLALALQGHLNWWLIPMGDWVSNHGAADGQPIHGLRPILLPAGSELVLTAVTLAGVIGLATFFFISRKPRQTAHPTKELETVTWYQLGVLIVPFTLAYLTLLLSRAVYASVYDRYLLVPILIALFVLLRFYQEQVRPDLPMASALVLAIVAGYGIASTHDTFSMFRGRLGAIQELQSAGVPATAIDGGFDYNSWTQIVEQGHINYPLIEFPAGAYVAPLQPSPLNACLPALWEWIPAVDARYALSFDPNACAGLSRFAPVTYSEWLGPRRVPVYIVGTRRPEEPRLVP